MRHDPKISRIPYFSSSYIYVVVCSCGTYRTGKHVIDLRAWDAWLEHREAKTHIT